MEDKPDNQKSKASKIKYYDKIFDTPTCIKIFDPSGKIIYVNKYGRDEHFIKDTDDIGKWDWLATIKEPYRSVVKEKFNEVLNNHDKSATLEFEHTPEGSKHTWCLSTITSVKDPDGNIDSVTVYSNDISELKHAELVIEQKERENKSKLDNLGEESVKKAAELEALKKKIMAEQEVKIAGLEVKLKKSGDV